MRNVTVKGIEMKARRVVIWLGGYRHRKRYPLILQFLWFLMVLGFSNWWIVNLAHRIYEEVSDEL